MRKLITAALIFFSCLSYSDGTAQFSKEHIYWKSRNLIDSSEYLSAIEMLNILIDMDESLHEALYLRGVAKFYLGDYHGAESDLTKTVSLNPVYAMAYHIRGGARATMERYEDAINDYSNTILLRPDFTLPLYNRAVAYFMTQQYDKAVEDLNNYIVHNDRNATAYIIRGMSYLNMKDTVPAYDDFDMAIRIKPLDPEGYYRRGVLNVMQDRYQEAMNDLNAAIRNDSSYIYAFFSRADLYYRLEQPRYALRDLDRAIELDSTNMTAYFNRAIIRTRVDDYKGALQDYNTVVRNNPNNVTVYYNRGRLNAFMNNVKAAIDDFSKAIELYPDFTNAYLYRADLKLRQNDTRGSRSDRQIAQRKIDEYRSRVADGSFSIYADTSQHFNQLLSLDTKFARGESAAAMPRMQNVVPLPSFRFVLSLADPGQIGIYRYDDELNGFLESLGDGNIIFTSHKDDYPMDSLLLADKRLEGLMADGDAQWVTLFERGIVQSSMNQYVNAIAYYSEAIGKEPDNPFLYINRGVTRGEMIRFVASAESSASRGSLGGQTDAGAGRTVTRTSNYGDVISDLNRAAKLLPRFPYIYYNRGNVYVMSGRTEEAFDDYSTAIELYPGFAEAYFNRGLIQIYMMNERDKGMLDMGKAGELGIKEAYDILKSSYAK